MKKISISPTFSKSLLASHSLLGVLFAALIYLVCFSGTLAVVFSEFNMWEAPEGPFVETVSPDLFEKVGAAAYKTSKEAGYDHAVYVVAPTNELPRLLVTGYKESGEWRQWMADADGNLSAPPHTPWANFLRLHHYNFHLPGMIGYYIVGLIGSLLIASLISGVVAHRRILKDAFRLRLGGSARLSNADLHNRIGVWALPFHLIVSLTGSLLGLASLLMGMVAFAVYDGDQDKAWEILFPTGATEDHSPAELPDTKKILAKLEARQPGAEIVWIGYDHMGTKGQAVLIATAEEGYLTRSEIWTYSGDGDFRTKIGYTDGSIGMRIYGMLAPLHFGTYGGLPLKLIYMVLGMGLTLIVATGVNVWLARKRDQGHAKPHWERVWTTLTWGQITAFALAAILELLNLAPALWVYWVTTLSTILVAAALRTDKSRITAAMKVTAGLLLLLLAGLHITQWGVPSVTAGAIDLALFVAGILLTGRFPLTKSRPSLARDSL